MSRELRERNWPRGGGICRAVEEGGLLPMYSCRLAVIFRRSSLARLVSVRSPSVALFLHPWDRWVETVGFPGPTNFLVSSGVCLLAIDPHRGVFVVRFCAVGLAHPLGLPPLFFVTRAPTLEPSLFGPNRSLICACYSWVLLLCCCCCSVMLCFVPIWPIELR